MKQIQALGAALVLALVASLGQAQELTPQLIDRWMATMSHFQAQDEVDDWDLDDDVDDWDPHTGFSAMQEKMVADIKQSPEAMAVIREQGFSSAESWAETGMRVFRAYGAIHMEEEGGGADQVNEQMRQALAELNNNPHLSEEQKAMMRQQMGAATQMMDAYMHDIPPSDKAAVQTRRQQLQQLFEQ